MWSALVNLNEAGSLIVCCGARFTFAVCFKRDPNSSETQFKPFQTLSTLENP